MQHRTKDLILMLILTLVGAISAFFLIAKADNTFSELVAISEIPDISSK